jgi:hypothetical protein
MTSRIKWLFILVTFLCLGGCGGGGGGTSAGSGGVIQPPGTQPVGSAATLRVGVSGVSATMSGIKATITLPAGVTISTNTNGSVPVATVQPIVVLTTDTAALFPDSLSYDPATRVLSFIFYSKTQVGFAQGEFASVACRVTGATPAAGDFSAVLEPVDLSGTVLPLTGVTASFLLAAP